MPAYVLCPMDTHKVNKAASDYSDTRVHFSASITATAGMAVQYQIKRQLQITYHALTTTVAQIIQIYTNGHVVPLWLVPQIPTNILDCSQQTVVGMS